MRLEKEKKGIEVAWKKVNWGGKGFVFGALVMLFLAALASVGVGISTATVETPVPTPEAYVPTAPTPPPPMPSDLLNIKEIGKGVLKITIEGVSMRQTGYEVALTISNVGDKGVYIVEPYIRVKIVDNEGIEYYPASEPYVHEEKFSFDDSVKEVLIIRPEEELWLNLRGLPQNTPITTAKLTVTLSQTHGGGGGGATLTPIKAGISTFLKTSGPAPTTTPAPTSTPILGENPFNYQGEYTLDLDELRDEEKAVLPYVMKYANEYKVSPCLIMAVIRQESDFFDYSQDSDKDPDKFDIGYMQVSHIAAIDTYKEYTGDEYTGTGEEWQKDGLNPDKNIKYGTRYLRIQYNRIEDNAAHYEDVYDDLLESTVSAYNAGHPTEDNEEYVDGVIKGRDFIDGQQRGYDFFLTIRVPVGGTPATEEGVPGFEAIFAIAGLLAVVYLLKRRK